MFKTCYDKVSGSGLPDPLIEISLSKSQEEK